MLMSGNKIWNVLHKITFRKSFSVRHCQSFVWLWRILPECLYSVVAVINSCLFLTCKVWILSALHRNVQSQPWSLKNQDNGNIVSKMQLLLTKCKKTVFIILKLTETSQFSASEQNMASGG